MHALNVMCEPVESVNLPATKYCWRRRNKPKAGPRPKDPKAAEQWDAYYDFLEEAPVTTVATNLEESESDSSSYSGLTLSAGVAKKRREK